MIDCSFIAAPLALLLILSACASSNDGKALAPAPVRTAVIYGKAPVELAGADAQRLIALFGKPRLDMRERTARKLQFANGRCVLDAYLYVLGRRKEPVVAHIDTRLATGADVDQNSCIQSLRVD